MNKRQHKKAQKKNINKDMSGILNKLKELAREKQDGK